MYARLKKIASNMALVAGTTALLAGVGSSDALAQKFEHAYGGPLEREAGRGGVQPVSDDLRGGYISAGESFTPGFGTSSDVYVVRTNNDGSRAWAQTYDLGGNDSATDIQEVLLDPSGRRGFIVTGVSDRPNKERCWGGRDLFLMRLDECGNVIWTRIYGRPDFDEIGWDVVEAEIGGNNTRPGDFIVSGITTFPGNCRDRNGLILRTDYDGNMIWNHFYDGPNNRDDYFYAVEECIADGSGDVVAAGGTNSYSSGTYDAWIVRVSGDDGGFRGAPHNAVAYGDKGFEELRSIQELRNSSSAGDLIAVGSTSSGFGSSDVYLLQTGGDPCKFVNDRTLGDADVRPDEGYCVREVRFTDGAMRNGDLVITGYLTTTANNPNGSKDVFVQTYEAGTLNSFTPVTAVYGGDRTDWGWSIAPVQSNECRTAGFVVAGLTNSTQFLNPFDIEQLYLFKTSDRRLDRCDNCSGQRVRARQTRPGYKSDCKVGPHERFMEECRFEVKPECLNEWNKLCIQMECLPFCEVDRCNCP